MDHYNLPQLWLSCNHQRIGIDPKYPPQTQYHDVQVPWLQRIDTRPSSQNSQVSSRRCPSRVPEHGNSLSVCKQDNVYLRGVPEWSMEQVGLYHKGIETRVWGLGLSILCIALNAIRLLTQAGQNLTAMQRLFGLCVDFPLFTFCQIGLILVICLLFQLFTLKLEVQFPTLFSFCTLNTIFLLKLGYSLLQF